MRTLNSSDSPSSKHESNQHIGLVLKILMWCVLIALPIMSTGCTTNSNNRSQVSTKINMSSLLAEQGADIIGEVNDAGRQIYVYFIKDSLFKWEEDSTPVRLYNDLSNVSVVDLQFDFDESGANLKKNKKNLKDVVRDGGFGEETAGDVIFKTQPVKDVFSMYGNWLFIGGDYMANVLNPYEVLDISSYEIEDLRDYTHKPMTQNGDFTGDVWTGKFSLTGLGLSLILYGEKQQLPGFNNYPANCTMEEWQYTGIPYSEDNYKYDTHFWGTAPIKNSNSVFNINIESIEWRHNTIAVSDVTPLGMNKYYKERDEEIQINIPLIREQERQNEISRILAQSVYLQDVIDAYNSNPTLASKNYPVGKRMIIQVNVPNILPLPSYSSDYRYRMGNNHWYIYTNEEIFVDFEYPKFFVMEVVFRGRSWEDNWHWVYYFSDAKYLLNKN